MPARPHRSVDRIIRLLEEVASSTHGCTLADLSRALDAPKSTVQGFANGLVETGYLDEQQRRYFPGPGIFMLANRSHRIPSHLVNHSDLVELSRETGCSVLVGVLAGRNLLYVDMELQGRRHEYFLRQNPRRPTLRTAAGKLLVALKPYEEMRDFLAGEEDAQLVQDFLGEVDDIITDQRCLVKVSNIPNVSALAAPIRSPSGHVIGALSLTSTPEGLLPRVDEIDRTMTAAIDQWMQRSDGLVGHRRSI